MQSFDRLSAQDTSFVMFEHRNTPMHVSATAVFDLGPLALDGGGLDVGRIVKHIGSRIDRIPRYRQKLAFTPLAKHPVWVDDEGFEIAYHVRHVCVPKPGDDECLKKLVAQILSTPLDRDKPLWEIWLVEGLDRNRFAMVSKVHHCMVDGAAGTNLMTLLFSTSPDEQPAPEVTSWEPRPAPSQLELGIDEIRRRAIVPFDLAREFSHAARHPRKLVGAAADQGLAIWEALKSGIHFPPDAPFNRTIGPHRRVDWFSLELSELKEAGRLLGCTINDIVLTTVAGGVRRFLASRDTSNLDQDFRIVVPVNRRSDTDQSVDGNCVSALLMSIPVSERNPITRARRIHRETERLKESRAAEGIELLSRSGDWLGSTLLTQMGVQLASRVHPYNLIVTNVPGPQMGLYVLGARMLALYPQVPLFENQGVGIAVMSHHGRVHWGLTGDWGLVPDLANFRDALEDSFVELLDAAGEWRRQSTGGCREEPRDDSPVDPHLPFGDSVSRLAHTPGMRALRH
jgi:diacylglycerol O-acyltransferase